MPDDSQLIEYQCHANGIHEIIFLKSSRAACEACVDRMVVILVNHPSGETLRIIVDVRPDGLPPVTFMYSRMSRLLESQREIPKIHAAYLYSDNTAITLARTFLDLLRVRAKRRFFTGPTARNAALLWFQKLAELPKTGPLTS